MTIKLEQLVRYPVKGLGPDYVKATDVCAGGAMPFDREYAIAHGASEFDPETPQYLRKQNFLMLMKNPPLAALKTTFFEAEQRLSVTFPDGSIVSSCLDDAPERAQLEAALDAFIGGESSDGPLRIASAQGHHFFDVPQNYLSLINLASVEDLGRTLGTELDPIRFRANVHVSGLPAWSEVNLVGREFVCGTARLRAAEAIERCAATSVNPATASRDIHIPALLRKHYNTRNMGLYLEVVEGGRLATGEELTLV